ncbi:TniQ family protein [Paenibacillus sp. FSL K6-2524]|uniref:TniQ family protein n=1 Tax=Paenibacillus sp. FSL K6-2524 TaxID=2954516 RepID=UPI0030FBF2FC
MKSHYQPLLIRPSIYHNESLSGFLYRLAHWNGYFSVSHLNSRLGLSVYESQNNEFSGKAMERLGELVFKEVDMLEKHNGHYLQNKFGIEFYKKNIMKNKVKYCPICIKENYFHQFIWNILPVHLCGYHHVLLVDSCPKCNSRISMGSFMNGSCNRCLFSFKETNIISTVNDILLESQKQIIEGFRDKNFPIIDICDLVHFFQLAYHSFHLLIGAQDFTGSTPNNLLVFYNRVQGEKSGLKMAIALANVYWMYLDFPKRFYYILDVFLSRNQKMQRYERLKKFELIFNNSTFLWLKKAYVSYFIKQIDEGFVRKDFSVFKREPELLLRRSRVRREEVRQYTGIAYCKLHELSDYNELEIETKLTTGTNIYLVGKSKLDDYLNVRKNLISKKEVGLLLGINVTSVQKLVEASYISPIKIANSPIQMFNIQEAKKLIENCSGSMVTEVDPPFLRFHDALIKYSVNNLTVVKIVEFTLSGMLMPYRLTSFGTFADNYYRENELQSCLDLIKKERQREKGFFFSDVMKMFKIGEKRLWRILKEQDIQADFTLLMKDGRKRYYFKEETILKIKGVITVMKELE